MPKEGYDYAFVDLWHDISDGVSLYLRMKKLEKKSPNTKYLYWIEDSILSNLRFCVGEALLKEISNKEEANKLMNIMQVIGEEFSEDGITAYEREFRHRLVAIANYFSDKRIGCFSDMAYVLSNDFLRNMAKEI